MDDESCGQIYKGYKEIWKTGTLVQLVVTELSSKSLVNINLWAQLYKGTVFLEYTQMSVVKTANGMLISGKPREDLLSKDLSIVIPAS